MYGEAHIAQGRVLDAAGAEVLQPGGIEQEVVRPDIVLQAHHRQRDEALSERGLTEAIVFLLALVDQNHQRGNVEGPWLLSRGCGHSE